MKRFTTVLTITAILGLVSAWSAVAGDKMPAQEGTEASTGDRNREPLRIETTLPAPDWLAGLTELGETGKKGKAGSPKPSGDVDCLGGNYCSSGYSCCKKDSAVVCCPSGYPHWCKSTGYCYQYITDATAACGSEWTVCWVPVDP